jgi:hypothetical protein
MRFKIFFKCKGMWVLLRRSWAYFEKYVVNMNLNKLQLERHIPERPDCHTFWYRLARLIWLWFGYIKFCVSVVELLCWLVGWLVVFREKVTETKKTIYFLSIVRPTKCTIYFLSIVRPTKCTIYFQFIVIYLHVFQALFFSHKVYSESFNIILKFSLTTKYFKLSMTMFISNFK